MRVGKSYGIDYAVKLRRYGFKNIEWGARRIVISMVI